MANKAEILRLLRKIFNNKREAINASNQAIELEKRDALNKIVNVASYELEADIKSGNFDIHKVYEGGLKPDIIQVGQRYRGNSINKELKSEESRIQNVGGSVTISFIAPENSKYYKLHLLHSEHREKSSPYSQGSLERKLQKVLDDAEEKVILKGANSKEVEKVISTLKSFPTKSFESPKIEKEETYQLSDDEPILANIKTTVELHTHGV